VDVHDEGGAALSLTPAWPAALDTNVYADQDAGVDAAISEIVAANLGHEAAAPAATIAQRGRP